MYNHPGENKKTILSKLKLNNFRNYEKITFDFNEDIIVIFGANGVGKTNILEAITLLNKGSGLRSAEFDSMINKYSPAKNFTIYSSFKNHPKIDEIGTFYDQGIGKKIFKINNQATSKDHDIKHYPTIIWLTPLLDNIFSAAKITRRKFLDKLVADIDYSHQSRINKYEQLLRERLSLLDKYSHNISDKWLNIIEREIAELGSAIAIARNQTIEYLNKAIEVGHNNFIKAKIKIIGELEEMAPNHKAIYLEEIFAKKLYENRKLDAQIGRTNFGAHRSEFTAILLDKNLEAKLCSTGEQKSVLIAITLARIELFLLLNLPSPILLLDEIMSHLDTEKNRELSKELNRLQAQCFLTGTAKELFNNLENNRDKKIQFLEINNYLIDKVI